MKESIYTSESESKEVIRQLDDLSQHVGRKVTNWPIHDLLNLLLVHNLRFTKG